MEVVLVTDDNIGDYVPAYDLHPAFPYLSSVHKADYLEAYFMHTFGGAFHDIKRESRSFLSFFKVLENNSDAWALGYKEQQPGHIGCFSLTAQIIGIECHQVKDEWRHLIGNGMGIFRPRTPLTSAWLALVHRRLDGLLHVLKEHPSPFPRCCFNHENGYPLTWNELKGGTLHPLEAYFKHAGRLLQSLPYINLEHYRSSTSEDVP